MGCAHRVGMSLSLSLSLSLSFRRMSSLSLSRSGLRGDVPNLPKIDVLAYGRFPISPPKSPCDETDRGSADRYFQPSLNSPTRVWGVNSKDHIEPRVVESALKP